MVDGLLALQRFDVKTPINIGNSEAVSNLELAHRIIDFTDSKSDITHYSKRTQDPPL